MPGKKQTLLIFANPLLFLYAKCYVLINVQVDSGSLTEPLWDAATVPYPYPNNTVFVRDYTIKLLGSSFPNMTAAEVGT